MHINCLKSHYAGMSNRSCIQIYWYCTTADPGAASLLGLRVRILRGQECLSLVVVGFCQAEVSARGRSLVQRSPTECDVSVRDLETSTTRRPWPKNAIAPQGTKQHW
jgi:hypothetical protein